MNEEDYRDLIEELEDSFPKYWEKKVNESEQQLQQIYESDEWIQKLLNETKTANRKTLSKWAEELDEETKIPPMSRKDKWDTFERLVKRIESLNISRNQADKLIKIIENSLWGSTSNLK